MRKIREILRLHLECRLTQRQISASTGVSKGTVSEYLRRAAAAGLTWQEARDMGEVEVEARLFRLVGRAEPPSRAAIDMAWVHREMRRMGVTLTLLWSEYATAVQEGPALGAIPYGYSQFCELYSRYQGHVDVTMRQEHKAGEKVFIDYSGKRPCIHDAQTGEVIAVELYVAVMGASNFTFAEATRTQTKRDFCASTVRTFEFFGATPRVAGPNQLRSAVKGPDRYDPEHQPHVRGAEPALRCGHRARPCRRAPGQGQGRGRSVARPALDPGLPAFNRTFFSLDDLNVAIAELLVRLNTRPFQKLEGMPALGVRDHRPTGDEAAARHTVAVLRPQAGPGQHRLPRRHRRVALQRALPTGAGAGRRALHRRDRRDLPPGQARGQPPAPVVAQGHGEHAARASAQEPSRLRRLATVAADRVGQPPGGPTSARWSRTSSSIVPTRRAAIEPAWL